MVDNIKLADVTLKIEDVAIITDRIRYRQKYFPDETLDTVIAVVLFNAGSRYTPVSCIEGEWEGVKGDPPHSSGIPQCPNGHVLLEGKGVVLGWVPDYWPC